MAAPPSPSLLLLPLCMLCVLCDPLPASRGVRCEVDEEGVA